MRVAETFELPPELQREHRHAVRLVWLSIVYLLSAIVLLYFVKGNSQALKTAWIDDMLALIPPVVFLLSARYRRREPDEGHPYGFHRAPSLAFLVAAVALLGMGAYLLVEATIKLLTMEHPSIGTLSIFGHVVWVGYAAAVVMAYKIVVGYPIGRAKQEPARRMHNKVLFADATMIRADWMTAAAAGVGVLLVGAGWWWADATAALLISLSIVRDGLRNVGAALGDLMDRHPETVDGEPDEVVGRVERELESSPLVREARVRLRENGQVFFGEAMVIPWRDPLTPLQVVELSTRAKELDWRIHDLVVAQACEVEQGSEEAQHPEG